MPESSKQKLAYQKAYNARPENVAKRVKNNQARAEMVKAGRTKVGDGKDVAHRVALDNGGSNDPSNLSVESQSKNRGWRAGSGSYNPDKRKK